MALYFPRVQHIMTQSHVALKWAKGTNDLSAKISEIQNKTSNRNVRHLIMGGKCESSWNIPLLNRYCRQQIAKWTNKHAEEFLV